MGVITGVAQGSSGTFEVSPVGGALADGEVPAWGTTSTTVTLAPSTNGMSVVASVPAGDADTSFDLTASAHSLNGKLLSKTVTVPIIAAAATDLDITQTA